MPSVVKIYDYSPELFYDITADLAEEAEIYATDQVIAAFTEAGLPVKIKHVFPNTAKAYFRVLCYIRKSAESVIINTRDDKGKSGKFNGLNIQVRITDHSVFEKLGDMPENVRDSFINANECVCCSPKCEGKKYVFQYGGTEYTKCQYLCSNFRFRIHCKTDADSIIGLVRNEIALRKK